MEDIEKIEYWLREFGMPEDNIENCATQIAQGYGVCRYLDGVKAGAEAVNELEKEGEELEKAANKYIRDRYSPWLYKSMFDCFKAGAQWLKNKIIKEG